MSIIPGLANTDASNAFGSFHLATAFHLATSGTRHPIPHHAMVRLRSMPITLVLPLSGEDHVFKTAFPRRVRLTFSQVFESKKARRATLSEYFPDLTVQPQLYPAGEHAERHLAYYYKECSVRGISYDVAHGGWNFLVSFDDSATVVVSHGPGRTNRFCNDHGGLPLQPRLLPPEACSSQFWRFGARSEA